MERMYVLGLVLLALSFGARLLAFPIVTPDYTYFLAKWFDALSSAPFLSAFVHPFADYAPLYLYLVKFLTLLPVQSLYSIKALSVLFDVAIALLACLVLWQLGVRNRARLVLSGAIVLAIPTVILNSALWGQSDALYTAGIILCVWCIFSDRPFAAVLAFAVAFCFKFQAVFFLPIVVGYLLRKQETIPYIMLVPLVFIASIVPAWFGGGQFGYWALMYAKQSSQYTDLSMSSQSVFAFVENVALSPAAQNIFFWTGLTVAALAALAVVVCMARAGLSSNQRVLLLCLLCVALIPYLLPRMHERYFYLADILSVLYALYVSRQWYIPLLVVSASMLSYVPYLSQVKALSFLPAVDLRIPSLLMLAAFGCIAFAFTRMPEISEEHVAFSKP
jgi:Gpi18-like mannosyltransferase